MVLEPEARENADPSTNPEKPDAADESNEKKDDNGLTLPNSGETPDSQQEGAAEKGD